jgi:hypothetical protein
LLPGQANTKYRSCKITGRVKHGSLRVASVASSEAVWEKINMMGAALNAFFPLYIAALVVSVVTLILTLSRIEVAEIAASFRPKTPVRIVGGYLVFVAVGLTVVWMGMWAAYVFADQPTPIEPEAFKLVAALDLTIMLPALAFGGVLLWRREAWGYVVAAIAGIQGSLYLLVLSSNSVVFILRGLAEAPGELPQWGTLAVSTTAVTVLLLANVRGGWQQRS